jgi:phage terminase large subunit-like protein
MTSSDLSWLESALLAGQPAAVDDWETALERWDAQGLTPGEWNRRFLPHYFGRFAPADFHAVLDADLHDLHTRRGSRLSYIAPRGGAKSTWCTLAYPLRAALEGWEPYTLILSDSSEQADELLKHIKSELETNEILAAVYPDAAGVGPEWAGNRIRLRNGTLIGALGSGKKVRGRRNRSERPSLIVFDDIQSNADVTSPTLRARAWEWATREVIPAGDERTNFLAVGSAIHREAVSVRLGALAGWVGRTFAALHSWPDRMDLWDRFVILATNEADEDRAATARRFYAENRAEMDAGGRAYWPARYTLADLMLRRAEVGHNAFLAEYQGVPVVSEGAEFPGEWFGQDIWFDVWPDGLHLKVIALDPSKGSDGKGDDYQAHVLVGVAVEGGRYVYYVDADLQREGVVPMTERTVRLTRDFGQTGGRPVDSVVVEENGTLGLLPQAFDAACAKLGLPIPYVCRTNRDNKELRVRAWCGPPLSRRQLRFRRSPGGRMLVGQAMEFPQGSHDDAVDALATALRRVTELLR